MEFGQEEDKEAAWKTAKYIAAGSGARFEEVRSGQLERKDEGDKTMEIQYITI